MAFLQPQTVSLSFSGGLNSKTDSLQLKPPAVLSLENAKFDKVGALNKRPGYNILDNSIMGDGQITSAVAIDTYNEELNLFDNVNIYTYIPSVSQWVSRGPAISVINTNNEVVRSNAAQQLNPDVAYLDNIKVFIWEDSRGPSCRYSVIDQTTNAYIIADQLIIGSSYKPKAVTFNDLIYIFYIDKNTLYYRIINPRTPNLISQAQPAASDVLYNAPTTYPYDITVAASLIITYFSSDVSLVLFTIDAAGTIANRNVIATSTNAVENLANLSVSVIEDSTTNIWITWSTGSRIICSILTAGFIPLNSLIVIDTVQSSLVSICESISLGSLQVIYEIVGNISSNQFVRSQIVQLNGGLILIGQLLSVGIASKPYRQGNDIFINLAYQSQGTQYFVNGPILPLQNTYFTALLTNKPFTIISKISAGVSGGLRTNHMLSEVVSSAPNVWLWANLVKDKLISEGSTTFTLLGVSGTTSDYSSTNKFNNVTFSNNLLFVGGILQSYDGVSVSEQNFHLFPEDITYSIIPGIGNLSAGQYQYQMLYAWTDKFGQIQLGTPSPSITITAATNDAPAFLVPTLRLTAKSNVVIKIYRTQVNGTVFQETTDELAPLLNDTSVNVVSFIDINADADISANQVIYTTGGVFPNSAPPSCSLITLYNDRVILGGLEDPNLLWFSKNKVDNSNYNTIPIEFTALNTQGVNQLGGPITALALMDDNLIIFKKAAIFIMSGDGTNDEGGGTPFNVPQLITQSVGSINANSLQLTTNGLLFQTPNKGIWMLPRSLGTPTYVGSGVDNEAKQFIVSSSNLDPNSNSVIFTTSSGPALVYDYLIEQWSTWTNHKSIDGVIFNGQFTFVKTNGAVYQQDSNIFYDGYVGGFPISYEMEVVTPWIAMAQNLGYQSLFKFFILGTYKGAHNLNVAVGFNFNPSFTEQAVIPATALAGSNVWGSDSLWGESSPWGGEFSPYIFQVNTTQKRCTSFRIKINDSQTSTYNEGFTLSNLLFELGMMQQGIRIPATNKVAAK